MIQILPEYVHAMRGEVVAEWIGPNFTFKGPGFYVTDSVTLLIVACERDNWDTGFTADELFIAYRYKGRFFDTIFAHIGDIPGYKPNMIQVTDNWHHTCPAKDIDTFMGDDFVFTGPGFYLSETDTLLIAAVNRENDTWAQKYEPDELFGLFCYNTMLQNTIFGGQLIPTRKDTRP